ncbi:hypothetical protein GJAV_G00075720 [Gymnothorax javanicus]|nr:hypothetical protein GJAV_G00075720 [Gymnothorax javanicus]
MCSLISYYTHRKLSLSILLHHASVIFHSIHLVLLPCSKCRSVSYSKPFMAHQVGQSELLSLLPFSPLSLDRLSLNLPLYSNGWT